MKPEEKAEVILIGWLKEKAEFVEEIYVNRDKDFFKELNCKKFHIRGNIKTPDLIIQLYRGFGKKYIVVEVKSSTKSKNISDANKIIDYYCLYVKGETKYYINNQEIDINHFVVASDKSKDGHLYLKENVIDSLLTADKGKSFAIKTGIIPRYEGTKTSNYVRSSLWKWFENIKKEYDKKCGLGILIADINSNFIPKIFINTHEFKKQKRKREWCQKWWKI